MFQEEYSALANAAENKSKFLKNNPVGYCVAAMLASIYVGFGILLIFSAGGMICYEHSIANFRKEGGVTWDVF